MGLFNSGMKETQTNQIEIHEFSFEIIEKLVNFMYTSVLTINTENVYEIYQGLWVYF